MSTSMLKTKTSRPGLKTLGVISAITVLLLAITASIAFADAPIPADPQNPGAPSGDGIQPVEYLDNPSCADFAPPGETWYELKVEPVADGPYDDGFLFVTVDEYGSPSGQVFDWSSNIGVEAIFVKGGNNGNFYLYDPPSENLDNTALHASINPQNNMYYDLSYISFCYDVIPSVDVDKDGDELSKVGDTVTYDITIINDGEPSLTLVSVTDTLLGDLTATANANGCATLAVGASCSFSVDRIVQAGDPDPLPNTVTAEYTATLPDNSTATVTDFDDHSVNLFQPAIELTKTGDALSKIGDAVDYVIMLENNSSADTPDLTCTVTDATVGVNETFSVASAADYVINVNGFVIPDGASDPFVNTASVTCSPAGFPNVYEDSASWSTNLFQPSINVVKTGDQYSKNFGGQADEITYNVTIYNTSSQDTPNLSIVSWSDTLVPAVAISADCADLDFGESCSFSYTYTPTVEEGQGDALVNTFNALYSVDGFPNEVSDNDGSNTWTVTLVHPDFEVSKTCTNEPVPIGGSATWDVVISNTGDVELIITADDGIGTFNLAAGASQTFPVSLAGPFSGQATVFNEVTASWVLPEAFGLSNTDTKTASDTCRVGSRVDVLKLTNGQPTTSQTWTFEIYEGPDGFGDTPVASDSTPPTLLDFGLVNLDPLQTYTLCELGVPAGFSTFWQIDTDGDGVGDVTVIPYNPNADDSPPEDLGNRCVDFGANTNITLTPGETLHFVVDNQQPGGAPRTPGYWKNWNTCTGGNQQYTAAANGGWQEGFWLLEDVLDPNIGGGIVRDDILTDGFIFEITECDKAVLILDKRNFNGKKVSSDPLHNLATHLLAAQLNFGAGACTTQDVLDAALDAEELLDKYNFDGYGHDPLPKKSSDVNLANQLANYLDQYNNGEFCGDGNN